MGMLTRNVKPMQLNSTPQALTGSSLDKLLAIISNHHIEKTYWLKLCKLVFWSTLLTPLYWLENILFVFARPRPLHPEPIFIIGHWRSGTTYLHYLLAKDKQFAYCTNADAFIPGALFIGRLLTKRILAARLPKKRPMDDVKINPDTPQEEEFAMMLLTRHSPYHSFVFPGNFAELLLTNMIFPKTRHHAQTEWIRHYSAYLGRLSHRYRGKRLLLKNPANTTRIKYLLSLFPKAKFIYLYRDPDIVKKSSLRMFTAMININKLQTYQETQLAEDIERIHGAILEEYNTQRESIPADNLIEIEYDDFIANPLQTINTIYETLNLSGFKTNEGEFEKFVEDQKEYKAHQYSFTSTIA
jgi:hypothetical protein